MVYVIDKKSDTGTHNKFKNDSVCLNGNVCTYVHKYDDLRKWYGVQVVVLRTQSSLPGGTKRGENREDLSCNFY